MYPCTKCGCCCKRVGLAAKLVEGTEFEFPFGWDDTGKCEKLGIDDLCTVYDDRPIICNIDKLMSVLDVNKDEYYKLNIESCNKMMDDLGVAESKRITI